MNKAKWGIEVQKQLGVSTFNDTAERAADAVLAAVKRGLRRDKEVSLVGFGVFAVARARHNAASIRRRNKR